MCAAKRLEGDDNRVTSVATNGISESYTYDSYGRVTQKVTKNGSTTVLTETYTYKTNAAGKPTGQVATLTAVSGSLGQKTEGTEQTKGSSVTDTTSESKTNSSSTSTTTSSGGGGGGSKKTSTYNQGSTGIIGTIANLFK